MKILQEIENLIKEFNQNHNEDFAIDSIRIEFSKEYKLSKLQELGKWSKLEKNSNILSKLKKRLAADEVTSAYRLENHNIYYYNKKDPAKKYRKAEMVIFGLKQYDKEPPPKQLVEKIFTILKSVSSLDICLDIPNKPNFTALGRYFTLTHYITREGALTDTHYINDTGIPLIERVVIYNKAFKNRLRGILWRIEAKIVIPNAKMLVLPLSEFKQITDLARGVI